MSLRDDFSALEIVHTGAMGWTASPSPGVWRKRLDRAGPEEAGRVTSVVRYDPGSRFHSHPHPDGEEILVLDGVFSDDSGDYPAGSYLLNPEGFSHAPRSADGCSLFVKLRQYPGSREHVALSVDQMQWQAHEAEGIECIPLYARPPHAETMHLLRVAAGVTAPRVTFAAGEEIFVLDGAFEDEHGGYRQGSWIRYPPGSSHQLRTASGCRLYVKKNHLGALRSRPLVSAPA
jgi:anti-sigma factor ChrR (cupin superfamily)